MTATAQRPTLKAVIALAERMCVDANRQAATDPYCSPYRPSEAAARQAFFRARRAERDRLEAEAGDADLTAEQLEDSEHTAAEHAIHHLRQRKALSDSTYRREVEESERKDARHARRLRRVVRDEDDALSHLSLGQRLDRALAALGAQCSEAPAGGALDRDVVRGGGGEQPVPRHQGATADRWEGRAASLVVAVEDVLRDSTRRRLEQRSAA